MVEIRKSDPMEYRKALKADQKEPKCIQRGPQKASQIREPTREIQRRAPGGALGPQRRPRGQPRLKSIKFLRKN